MRSNLIGGINCFLSFQNSWPEDSVQLERAIHQALRGRHSQGQDT